MIELDVVVIAGLDVVLIDEGIDFVVGVLRVGASENIVRSVLLLFKKFKLSVGFVRISASASYIETVCDDDCVIISASL
jgi:hypothetical protein